MSKGSKSRPYSVDQKTFDSNWDSIFGKKEDNTGTSKNEYYDILTTEDALVEMVRISEEMGAYVDEPIDNPLIKK
jgi:hypothetical protein